MTAAGDLREVVNFQLEEEAVDEFGNPIPGAGGWATQFSAPARIRILKGSEEIIAGRLAGTQTAVITIRYQPDVADIATSWRAKNSRDGVVYQIKAITPDERKAWVDILTQTGVGA